MHEEAATALNVLFRRNDEVYLSSQNLIEFWNVCTRPINRNWFGNDGVAQADVELTRLEGVFFVLPDTPAVYPEWRRLVWAHNVMGVNHDARLVAVMLVYGLTHILSFNIDDFRRFSEITVVQPEEICV